MEALGEWTIAGLQGRVTRMRLRETERRIYVWIATLCVVGALVMLEAAAVAWVVR